MLKVRKDFEMIERLDHHMAFMKKWEASAETDFRKFVANYGKQEESEYDSDEEED